MMCDSEIVRGDLDNFLARGDMAVIFLDLKLRVRRLSPAARRLFRLTPADLGGPPSRFESLFPGCALMSDAAEVAEKLIPREREVEVSAGRWFLQRVFPFRDQDDRIEGVVVIYNEVTAIKKMELEERRQAGFLRMLTNSMPVLICYVDNQERYRYANDLYYEWLGLHPEQIKGKKIRDVLGASLYDKIKQHVWRALAGESVTFEVELPAQSGRKNVLVDYSPHLHQEGKVQGFFAMVRDITSRRKEEAKLAWLAALVEHSTDAIISTDFNGKMLTWNNGAVRLFGYGEEEIINQHIQDYLALPASRDLGKVFRAMKKGRPVSPFESRWRHGRGDMIDVLLTMSPVKDGAGKKTAVSVIATDIGESKRLERELREKEEMYRTIGETIPFGVWTADGEGRCTYVAKPWLDTVGMSLDDVKEFRWTSRLEAAVIKPLVEKWLHCVETGENWSYEYRFRGKDGNWYDNLSVGRPVRGDDGRIRCWVGFNLDITGRKDMERRVQEWNRLLEEGIVARTKKLKEKMQQLRQVTLELSQTEQRERERLAKILHDNLQQLLVAARLRTEGLEAKLRGDGNRRIVGEIIALLDQTAETARSLAGELQPPGIGRGNLREMLRWLADWMLAHHELRTEIEFHRIDDGRIDVLSRDILFFLYETLKELLFNIVKHAETQEGHVRLEIDEKNCLHVIVSDKGRGAAGNPLEAGDQPSPRGLGLRNIQTRLKMLGGWMEVRSRPKNGFEAHLGVPIRFEERWGLPGSGPEDREQARHDDIGKERRKRIRILIVDDHKIVRDGLRLLLAEQHDFDVVGEADDGNEALRKAEEEHPDLVVMDVSMPVMNGIEATRLLKRKMPNVTVVGLSVADDSGTRSAMLKAGADSYLMKTGPAELLCNEIRRLRVEKGWKATAEQVRSVADF